MPGVGLRRRVQGLCSFALDFGLRVQGLGLNFVRLEFQVRVLSQTDGNAPLHVLVLRF